MKTSADVIDKLLFKDYEDLNVRNWDSYDGDPITPDVLSKAKLLAQMLLDPPDEIHPSPGGDGSICFELRWKDGREVWFDIDKDTPIYIPKWEKE
jgi:hypothetical protein